MKIHDGMLYSLHVSLRYRPFGPNSDIIDIFTGNSENEALDNLKKYKAICQEKYGHYISPFKHVENENNENSPIDIVEKPEMISKRGAHFVGTTWVAHTGTKDKRRINVSELNEYFAKGYVKAGPRTKV